MSLVWENYLRLSQRFRWLSVLVLIGLTLLSCQSFFLVIVASGLLPTDQGVTSRMYPGLFLQTLVTFLFVARLFQLILLRIRRQLSESLWLATMLSILIWAFVSYSKNYDCFYSGTYSCVDVSPNLFLYTTYEFQQALGFYVFFSIGFAVLLLLIALGQTVFQVNSKKGI